MDFVHKWEQGGEGGEGPTQIVCRLVISAFLVNN